MPHPEPSSEECRRAVARAAGARRTRHRRNPAFAHLTTAALAERVTGLTCLPDAGSGGWWRVGWIIDDIAETEFEVWCIPGERIQNREILHSGNLESPPPSDPVIFDGERMKWIDRETREPIADQSRRRAQ